MPTTPPPEDDDDQFVADLNNLITLGTAAADPTLPETFREAAADAYHTKGQEMLRDQWQ